MKSPPLIGIVDDNREVCEAIKSCLEVDGFTARFWTSGVDLLADSDLPLIKMLLLDWKMQPMDGLEVARRLTTLPTRPMIVMMTAARADQLREEAERIGVAHVLQKPLEGKVLCEWAAFLLR